MHRLICLVVGAVTVIEWLCRLQNFYFCHVSVIWPYVLQLFDSDCTVITVAFYFAWISIMSYCFWHTGMLFTE